MAKAKGKRYVPSGNRAQCPVCLRYWRADKEGKPVRHTRYCRLTNRASSASVFLRPAGYYQ